MTRHGQWGRGMSAANGRALRVLLAVLMLAASVVSLTSVRTTSGAAASTPILGVLNASGNYYQQERAVGVSAVTISSGWNYAEPANGSFSPSYAAGLVAKVDAAQAAGMKVVLDPGLQYPPAWVFALPGGTQFVDQYGDVFTGPTPSGNHVANAFTDLSVRAAEGAYLSWLGSQFPAGTFVAVRQGGGPLGELRYPSPLYNDHANCYWAYDSSSQAASPVPGWAPGTGTTAQAQAFLNAYNAAVDGYGIWLNGQLATDFATRELVMLPGWGQRPGGAAQEVASRLTLSMDEYNEGLDWMDLLGRLPDPTHSVAYTTYLDAPTVEPTPQLEDPADYLDSLVGSSLALGGENTGDGTVASMELAIGRARSLHFFIVQWMDEPQLISSDNGQDPGGPTLAELGAAAGTLPPPPTTTTTAAPPTTTTTAPPTTTTTTGTISPTSTTTSTTGVGSSNLSIAPGGLAPGTVGQVYRATLTATGGTPPYAWSLTSGHLPAGVALDPSTGRISGSPTVSGHFSLRVRVNDAAGNSAVVSRSLTVAAPASIRLTAPIVGIAASPDGGGYVVADAAGGVESFGTAVYAGSMAGRPLNSPINHIVMTPDGGGYWLVAADGGTFSFGDAGFFGSTGGMRLNAPVVDLAPTADGGGYWLVASDGGVFAFGDAVFRGSMGWERLNSPVVGISSDGTTGGYWMVASDGGVFAFDAGFWGSAATQQHQPIIGMSPSANGSGYRFVATNGGIFAYGSASFLGPSGALALAAPIVGLASDPATGGYWLIGADGGVFAFGAPFLGSA